MSDEPPNALQAAIARRDELRERLAGTRESVEIAKRLLATLQEEKALALELVELAELVNAREVQDCIASGGALRDAPCVDTELRQYLRRTELLEASASMDVTELENVLTVAHTEVAVAERAVTGKLA